MKPHSLLFLLFICAGAQVKSQSEGLAYLTLPDSLRQGANSIVVSSDYEFTATSDRSAEMHVRRVVTLLNNKPDHERSLYAFYDNDSKVTAFEITVLDASGKETFRSRKNDISDQRYDDNMSFLLDSWVKSAEVPCTGYPCTVITEVSKKMSDFAALVAFPHWAPVQREQSLLAARLRVVVPEANELLMETHLTEEAIVSAGDGIKTYEWKLTNLPAQSHEPLAPHTSETLPYVRTEPALFRIDDYSGSYRTWHDFGLFIGQLMEGRDALPPLLAAEVRETVAGMDDEREKIEILYRLMQGRCRYVSIQLGIGGWQPFSAAYVEENRFGDCKALSNFMGAMLREVGIASYPVLIKAETQPHYGVNPEFATSSFNHMVLYVPSQDMYLECTDKYAITGYIGESLQDRNVLWITPEGGKLARTPSFTPSDHGHVRTTNLSLLEGTEIAFDFHATYFGAEQETFRQLGAYIGDKQDQLDWLHQNNYLPDVTGSAYTYFVSEVRPEVEMAYETVLKNRVRKLGSRKFVALNPFPLDWVPDQMEARKLPVVYQKSRFFVDTVKVSFPANLEVESGILAEPIVYSHPAGEYRASMERGENQVVWTRTLKLRPVELPAEDYAAFWQFFVDKSKAENLQLVLKERQTK